MQILNTIALRYYFLLLTAIIPLITNAQQQKISYWQQHTATKINVILNDQNHTLNAFISIDYLNNSPDTLNFIYFHLYPNAYKNNHTAFAKQLLEDGNTAFYKSYASAKGYIDSLLFKVDNMNTKLELTTDIDVVKLLLPQPLYPGKSIQITTPFRVKIPETFSRLGHVGQSYQISQWFPKPAVYDADGWHPFPYLNIGEYYSEFGTYDVQITVPENYVVMATGNLETQSEQAWLEQRSKLSAQEVSKLDTTSAAKTKTVRFTESNVHDFAWFANKKWMVAIDEITIPQSENTIVAMSAYLPAHHKAWKKSNNFIKQAVEGFSSYVGAYPYKSVKVVEGTLKAGGGMEYPTITVIDAIKDEALLQKVVVHEVGHNWFYGILGSNERSSPWMDESFTSFYENIICAQQSKDVLSKVMDKLNDVSIGTLAAQEELQPICTHSKDFRNINYGIDLYSRGPVYISWLKAYMGDSTFDKAMKDYFHQWKFKHPNAKDLQKILQAHTEKDISWFFDAAITQPLTPDFAVKSKKTAEGWQVKNKNGLKIPFQIVSVNEQDTAYSQWVLPTQQTTIVPFEQGYAASKTVFLNQVIPDYHYSNNALKKPFLLKPFVGLNNQAGYKQWLSPALGYNYYDGFMFGALFHNISVPKNRLQYAVAPMFGFNSQHLVGNGFISYDWYNPIKSIAQATLQLDAKRFSYKANHMITDLFLQYHKLAPQILVRFKEPSYRSTVTKSLLLKYYWIQHRAFEYRIDGSGTVTNVFGAKPLNYNYVRLNYLHENKRSINPFMYNLDMQMNQEFIKIGLSGNLEIDYGKKNKSIFVRGFVGKYIHIDKNSLYPRGAYMLATNFNSSNDYLFDETYIGRGQTTNFWGNQSSLREGGFYSNTLKYAQNMGMSDHLLFATNVSVALPVTPLRIFGNFSYAVQRKNNFLNWGEPFQYELGLELQVTKYFSIASPLIVSKDFQDYRKYILGKNVFWKTLSFRINLADLNIGQLISKEARNFKGM